VRAPFWLRRPVLLARNLSADRERPDLAKLERTEDPERFVWAMLPHAARTFSACIALLPASAALPAAVAYLYCRMLDTYEDLVPDRAAREAALRAFAARLDDASPALAAAPAIAESSSVDARDEAHLLLVRRAERVDRVFVTFPPAVRRVVRDLVRDMAGGMEWSSATFAAQGGALEGEQQLSDYCRAVLGNPVVFTVRLIRLQHGGAPDLSDAEWEDAMQVGELVQLANVTRDLEKDLVRGVAYDASLRADLGREDVVVDPALRERIRAVRERMLRLALSRAPAYGRMLASMRLPPRSVARASAVLMLLFTERYYRRCAARCGLPWRGTEGPDATSALLARSFPAAFCAARAEREVARVEAAFAATRLSPG
jgi:phytoene/squalene synthetase